MSSFINFNNRGSVLENKYSAEVIKTALLKSETKSSAKAESLTKNIKEPVSLNEALVFFTDKLGAIRQLNQSIVEVNEGRVKQFEMDYASMVKDIKRGYGWIDPEYVADTWENSSDSIGFDLVRDEIFDRLIAAGLLAHADSNDPEKAGKYIKSAKDLYVMESEEVEEISEDRYYAFHKGQKHEIEADSLWGAKQKAITDLKVKKKDVGMLAIVLADSHDDFSKGKNSEFAFEGETTVYESATAQLADEEKFELYTATLKNKTATITATTTTKTWDDGVPVLKYLARGKGKPTQVNINGSFEVAHDVARGWFYFTDGRKWFGLHIGDGYSDIDDLPFNMEVKESVVNEGAFVVYIDGPKGKELLGTFHNKRAAEKYKSEEEDEVLNTKGVDSIGMMSKDMWDKKEAPYITEAKFVKDFNKDVLKAKTKEEVLELYPNAQFFIGKSDHFFGELDGNLFFKAYYTKAQKEFEIKSVYSQKGSNYVHLYNESVVTEGKFEVDDLVYNKRTKTVGIVRLGDDTQGEVKTDADGNVNVDELEKYNPIKFKHQTKAKVAPSTEKEVNSRGLFNPFKNESVVTEGISVTDERVYGKKGIIIMIDDNGKQVSAIFKDKKNADKYNRNKAEDIKALLDLAKDTKYPNAIDESVVTEGKFDKSKLLKALGKNHDGEILVNGKTYIIYNPDSGNDDNTAMWNDKSIFAVDQDGEEYEFKYSEIERFNESVVNESHFKVGDKVKMSHGGTGVIVSLDKEDGTEDQKYYNVELPTGEIHKHSPNELTKESAITEGRSVNKIQKEWNQVTTDMIQKVAAWKAAEGDRKAEILEELKALTAKKKALETELDVAVAGKDKDVQLVVSEGNAFGAARAEAIAKGEKEFTVDGETYKVEDVGEDDKENAEEFVGEAIENDWNYLLEKFAVTNEDLRSDIKKYIKTNKKEIDALADQDDWDRIYSMLMTDFEVEEDDDKAADELKTIFNIVY